MPVPLSRTSTRTTPATDVDVAPATDVGTTFHRPRSRSSTPLSTPVHLRSTPVRSPSLNAGENCRCPGNSSKSAERFDRAEELLGRADRESPGYSSGVDRHCTIAASPCAFGLWAKPKYRARAVTNRFQGKSTV